MHSTKSAQTSATNPHFFFKLCYNIDMANFFKRLLAPFKILYPELADIGESNRLHLLILTPFLFAFGFLGILTILIFFNKELDQHLFSLIYFGIFTIISVYSFIHAKCVKNVPREKAYILKTVPAYLVMYSTFAASVYNFYILKQPFNGVIIFFIIGFLGLITFSFSPFFLGLALAITLSVLSPGIFSNFGLKGYLDTILCTLLIFIFAVYKRRTEKRQIIMLKKQKKNLEAKTFGNFTMLYENQVVKYSRTKSEELMAYLIYKKGSSAKTKELISALWGDHADSSRYGSSLRNLIVDIKQTMNELEIQDFFIAEYNNFRINPDVIKCDYYDFLAGDPNAIKNFAGEFMSQYSWAEEIVGFLEQKALKK